MIQRAITFMTSCIVLSSVMWTFAADAPPALPMPQPVASGDPDPNPTVLRTAFSARAVAPDMIVCVNLGRVRLIGIRPPGPASRGFEKAMAAIRKYAHQKSVKLDICPVRAKDETGAARARVYFMEGGHWHNLNTKLLRSGLASAVKESPCHLTFETWPTLVQQARIARRGLFRLGIELPDEFVSPAAAVNTLPPGTPPGETPSAPDKKEGTEQ